MRPHGVGKGCVMAQEKQATPRQRQEHAEQKEDPDAVSKPFVDSSTCLHFLKSSEHYGHSLSDIKFIIL